MGLSHFSGKLNGSSDNWLPWFCGSHVAMEVSSIFPAKKARSVAKQPEIINRQHAFRVGTDMVTEGDRRSGAEQSGPPDRCPEHGHKRV